jgi:hypothetical protein|nr:MAG TPA: hypothetical protein [Caudoviricetes sp.]
MKWQETVLTEAAGVSVQGINQMTSLTRFKKEQLHRSWISPELS